MSTFHSELYKELDYQGLAPDRDLEEVYPHGDDRHFKFKSVVHLISWIESLEKRFERNSTSDSSNKGDYDFSLSSSLQDAFRVVRSTTFSSKKQKTAKKLLHQLKKSTSFSEEGFEIDVPEFIAGSEKHWLKDSNKKTRSRIINDHLFVEGSYNCNYEATTILESGFFLLTSLYSKGVIPRKLTLVFTSKGSYESSSSSNCIFVDLNFQDINGIAKALHPSTFRRILFRLKESFSDLSFGYGSSTDKATKKGYLPISTLSTYSDKGKEREIDFFLGL